MIRLIIDKLGSGHHDLFLKIDLLSTYVIIGDSYYLLDFLQISESEVEEQKNRYENILIYGAVKLVDYWVDRINSIKRGEKKFIPFQLSDEFISGLLIEKTKLGYKTKLVWTEKIFGWSTSKSQLDGQIEENISSFLLEEEKEWLISEQALFEGLEWSRSELLKQRL